MEDPKYIMNDVTPAEQVVHLDENGTTLKLENDELPEGATLVLNSDDVEEPAATPGAGTLAPDKFMSILRTMLASEKITHQQALELRHRFGITGSYFTKPKVDAAKKRRRKQMTKLSKRRNRYNGSTKGQKRDASR